MAQNLKLNAAQKVAVEHPEGALLVLAGAGTGKTRTIVHRIAHLIESCGVYPESVLAVTFTNKSAEEMRLRVERKLARQQAPSWISTFHSVCVRILRIEAHHLGISPRFTILNEQDQKKWVKTVAQTLNVPDDTVSVSMYRNFIERARNEGKLPGEVIEEGSGMHHEQLSQFYEVYHRTARENGTLDFGDLILAVIQLFKEHEGVRAAYQERWSHLLVDEFQDTNPAQYTLLKLLSRAPWNITVVGDDDQSIYTWRGATVHNILGFESDFSPCKVVALEQNYRSTQPILDLANALIEKNRDRMAKRLWTDRASPMRPTIFVGWNDREEAGFICRTIEMLQRKEEVTLDEIALFYRTNAQSRVYEEQLRRFEIPYRLVAATGFYEREEIRDILAYLRVISNPFDQVAALRIANVPRRGCGSKTMARAQARSRETGKPLLTALCEMARDPAIRMNRAVRSGLGQLDQLLNDLHEGAKSLAPSQLTNGLLETLDYRQHLLKTHPDSAEERWDNVMELLNGMVAYEEEYTAGDQGKTPTLLGFLERVALVQATDTENYAGQVNLMTIHAAKGLEFRAVFVVGMEEGFIPHQRHGDVEPENLDEERRLFYVAVTRAKERLFLTHCRERRIFGRGVLRKRSRFLESLPESLISEAEGSLPHQGENGGKALLNRGEQLFDGFDQRVFPDPDEEVFEDDEQGIGSYSALTSPSGQDMGLLNEYVGKRARHGIFGIGEVISAEFAGKKIKLGIRFPEVGLKKVISTYVEIF